MTRPSSPDWAELRAKIAEQGGIRNTNLTAVIPKEPLPQILSDVTPGIYPIGDGQYYFKKVTKMRYNVGEKTVFIDIDYVATTPRFGALYLPWEDTLKGIDLLMLTCAEHHKVTDGYSDQLDCDGFVFTDDNGVKWNNQYPSASYGQLDTSADYVVRCTVKEEGTKRKVATDLCAYLDNVYRGIRDMGARLKKIEAGVPSPQGDTKEWLEKAIASLRELVVTINEQLKTQHSLKAVNVGYTARYIDGSPPEHMADIPDFKLLPLDQEATHIEF
jgi:hypothetical protein